MSFIYEYQLRRGIQFNHKVAEIVMQGGIISITNFN